MKKKRPGDTDFSEEKAYSPWKGADQLTEDCGGTPSQDEHIRGVRKGKENTNWGGTNNRREIRLDIGS